MNVENLLKEFSEMSLFSKTVLLISNHGYSKQIADEIKSLGARVIVLNDKPNDGFWAKVLGRIKFKPYINHTLERYYADEIVNLSETKIDYILVIRGEYTPSGALKKLKDKYPRAKMILYMWDSLYNNKGIENKWNFYDEVWTFDRKDYLENSDRIRFLPLFYCERVMPHVDPENKNKYDLAFIGTGHGDRISIIKKIEEQCRNNNLDFYYYIYVPHIFVFLYNKIFNKHYRNVKLSDVHFNLMPLDEVYLMYSKSRCILDVESSTQTGLTMRTIEIVGLKKKLMTTNQDIINYDFYNEQNIKIFNRDNPKIEISFLKGCYREIDSEIYNRYSLRNWLLTLLGEK